MTDIIWNPETSAKRITLDRVLSQTGCRIGAGTPVNENGEVVNDGTAIGLLLHSVSAPSKYPVDVLTSGCVDEKIRREESGIELSDE